MVIPKAAAGLLLLGVSSASAVQEACEPVGPEAGVPPDLKGRAWSGHARLDGEATPVHVQADGRVIRVSFPERATYGYPAGARRDGERFCLGTPWQDQVWRLEVDDGGGLTGRWEIAQGREVEIALRSVPTMALPRERDLRFEAEDGVTLAGSLILPPEGEGPFITVVMGHGSPPDTRMTQHYLGRARWFARNGVAVFIWDKRGAGASGGTHPSPNAVLVADSRAARAAAREQREVDPEWIVAAGFSQAGFTMPVVAAEDDRVAGLLLGSAPGMSPAEQNVYSLVTRLPEGDRERSAGLLRQAYEYYRTGESYDALMQRLEAPANADVVDHDLFRRLLFHDGDLPAPELDLDAFAMMFEDPLPPYRELDVPVLQMWGSEDRSVPPHRSRDLIAAALAEAPTEDVVLWTFEGAGHGLMQEDPERIWTRTASGFQELTAGWLRRRVEERARGGG